MYTLSICMCASIRSFKGTYLVFSPSPPPPTTLRPRKRRCALEGETATPKKDCQSGSVRVE